jgi:hypothetical protein
MEPATPDTPTKAVPERGDYWQIKRYNTDSEKKGLTTSTREFAVLDDKAEAVIVTAVPATHKRIEDLLQSMEKYVGADRKPAPAQRYRVELALLKGDKARGNAARESKADPTSKTVTLAVGQEMAFRDLRLRLGNFSDQLITMNAVELVIRTPISNAEQVIRQYSTVIVDDYEISVLDIDANSKPPGCKVEIRYSSTASDRESTLPPIERNSLQRDYGITPDDLKLFGFTDFSPLGNGLVTLVGEPGTNGRARVMLSSSYSAELEYLDQRDPYIIVRGRLTTAKGTRADDSPLLENTLYLEKDKPTFLGLTNLKDALVLAVRLRAQ